MKNTLVRRIKLGFERLNIVAIFQQIVVYIWYRYKKIFYKIHKKLIIKSVHIRINNKKCKFFYIFLNRRDVGSFDYVLNHKNTKRQAIIWLLFNDFILFLKSIYRGIQN